MKINKVNSILRAATLNPSFTNSVIQWKLANIYILNAVDLSDISLSSLYLTLKNSIQVFYTDLYDSAFDIYWRKKKCSFKCFFSLLFKYIIAYMFTLYSDVHFIYLHSCKAIDVNGFSLRGKVILEFSNNILQLHCRKKCNVMQNKQKYCIVMFPKVEVETGIALQNRISPWFPFWMLLLFFSFTFVQYSRPPNPIFHLISRIYSATVENQTIGNDSNHFVCNLKSSYLKKLS